jgi:hypothetical protein
MKYINENGVVIETDCKISGNGWREVEEKKTPKKEKDKK